MKWKEMQAGLLRGVCVLGASTAPMVPMAPAMTAQPYWTDYDAGVAALERRDAVTFLFQVSQKGSGRWR